MTTGRINQITLLGMNSEPHFDGQRPVGVSPSHESWTCATPRWARHSTDRGPSDNRRLSFSGKVFSVNVEKCHHTEREDRQDTIQTAADVATLKIANGNRPADSQSESVFTQTPQPGIAERRAVGRNARGHSRAAHVRTLPFSLLSFPPSPAKHTFRSGSRGRRRGVHRQY